MAAPANYLGRLRERTAFLALKRQIVLGLVGGWLLMLLGGFRHLYVVTAREATSFAVLGAGAALFAVGLAWPQGLAVVERGIRAATGWIGKGILLAFLSLTYFLIITPVGVVWRALRGADPFYAWTAEAPSGMQGWVPKSVVDDRRSASLEPALRRDRLLPAQRAFRAGAGRRVPAAGRSGALLRQELRTRAVHLHTLLSARPAGVPR